MVHQNNHARRCTGTMPAPTVPLPVATNAVFAAPPCGLPHGVDDLTRSLNLSSDREFPMNHARASPI